jgi:hypothetical protein
MSSQVVPSAVVQSIVAKFLTNENVELAERRRAQFDDKTLSRIQAYDWIKLFKEGRI